MVSATCIKLALVDDHKLFRKGLTSLIEMVNKNCIILLEAVNGLDLQKKIDRNNVPDIVIMDINMPGMDGFASTHQASVVEQMNDREMEFLQFACTEMTYNEIASKMFLSPKTIDGYRDVLFEKLNVKSRIGLVMCAIRNRIVKVDWEY